LEFDLEQLRRQYADLTDEALQEIDSDELVEAARSCYDGELRKRGMRPAKRNAADAPDGRSVPVDAEPDWLEDAMSVMSIADASVLDAHGYLAQAGISGYIATRPPDGPRGTASYDLLVPPGQYLVAVSVLDRDFFNPQTELDWKAQFEGLSDNELMDIDADLLIAGLKDRMERLVRAYEDELLKRGLAELETSVE
jgi:hypothetical protein